MKTIVSLLLIVSLSVSQSFAVGCAYVGVSNGQVAFYNWSNAPYSLSGHYLTIGNLIFAITALNIFSGSLNVQPGETVVFTGLNLKTASVDPNSVALWGSNDTTMATGYMLEFVQWGAAGQPFEAKAVASNLWTAGDFIPGEPDYERDTYTFTQPISNEWTALDNVTSIADLNQNLNLKFDVTPNPFYDKVNISFNINSNEANSIQLYDQSGALLDQVNGIRGTDITLAEEIDLPAGIYFIRVSSADGSSTTKKVLKL